MQPDMTFEVASVTKMFTAVAIQKLREKGGEDGLELDLDDTFNEDLEELLPTLPKGRFKEHVRGLNLRLLLNHRGGLPHYWEDDEAFEKAFADDEQHFWTSEEILKYVAEDFEPVCEIGEFHYSDTGYLLLGLI